MTPYGHAPVALVALAILLLCHPLAAEPGAWLGTWEELGPAAAQANRIVPHPSDPDTLYARTPQAVLRSRDGGGTWQEITPAPALDPLGDLAIDPHDPEVLYTGGAPPFPLLKSTDGGASWAPAGEGLPCCLPCCSTVANLVIDPSDPDTVYAGIPNALVFKSTDGGQSFSPSGRGLPQGGTVGVIALDPGDSQVLYTSTFTHEPGFGGISSFDLFRSRDGGERWTFLDRISGTISDRLLAIVVDPGDPDHLYAPTTGALWQSRDRGRSWSFEPPPPPGRLSAFTLEPGETGLLYGGAPDGNVFVSPDEGESWLPLGAGQPSSQVLSLVVSPATAGPLRTGTLYAGTFEGGAYALSPDWTAPCLPDETTLCLLGDRFRAEVRWDRNRGRRGSGHADPLGDRAGTFFFFEEERPDLFVKLLDGRGVNDHFWVFFGGLTHVVHHLFVSDTETGRLRAYAHQGGRSASAGERRAFPGSGTAAWPAPSPADRLARAATASSTALPFAGDRFQVELRWQRPGGRVRTARGDLLPGGEAGYFWFSGPDNPELVVKVVDARSLVGAFWLYHAGLSNLAYTLTVTDTLRDTTQSLVHPEGDFASGTLVLPD